jgi:hypothetical protein
MRQWRLLGARAAALGTAIAVAALLRRRYLRWGATDDEMSVALPGDELVSRPDMTATRGVTIRAAADSVCHGSPSSARDAPAFTVMISWRISSAATFTAPTGLSPNGSAWKSVPKSNSLPRSR